MPYIKKALRKRILNDYLSPQEIADEMGVKLGAVRNWYRRGKFGEFPDIVKFGKYIRISPEAFNRFVRNYIKQK